MSIPLTNGTTSFWRTEPDELDSYRSSEKLPDSCDIVIIGAGYAGASLVHHILHECNGKAIPSILIVEARQTCSGATGRNGNFFYYVWLKTTNSHVQVAT